ncbi:hypothetical protein FA95DRAFT_1611823 [Auriscalpium vulgare]|uniref:Uncharacterized protein n=1 Tax=Auriscalpium vulgare TaxID=40419 RepID=A0ACB8R9C6_9AGAM|nr:hypothetical protein FA95DRAFT_1611823 [Auriscalpium vulgare]
MATKRGKSSLTDDARAGSRSPSPELTPAQKRMRTIAKRRAEAAAVVGEDGPLKKSTRRSAAASKNKAGSQPPQDVRRKAPIADTHGAAPPPPKKAKKSQHAAEDGPAERANLSAAEDDDATLTPPMGGFEKEDGRRLSPDPTALARTGGSYVEVSDDGKSDVSEGGVPEKEEIWVEESDDEEAGAGSRKTRRFYAGVPQWEGSDGASPAPQLTARDSHLEALAEADVADFDFNSVPKRDHAVGRSSHTNANRREDSIPAARKAGKTKGAGAAVPVKARAKALSAAGDARVEGHDERRGGASRTPAVRAMSVHDEAGDLDDWRVERADERARGPNDKAMEVGRHAKEGERARADGAGTSTPRAHTAGSWPSRTNFKRVSGTRISLGDQSLEVREVISTAAADEVPYTICFEDSYPDEERRVELLRNGLVRTAEKLNEKDIAARLQKDEYYVKLMVKIPEARVSNYRKNFKDAAIDTVQLMYGLENFPEAKYVQRMQKILEPEARLYIFPGEFDGPKMALLSNRPFCHPAISNVINKVCFGHRASRRFPRDYYVDIAQNKDKPELPRAMVAVAATAIEAGLRAFALDPRAASKIDFSGDVFGKVYKEHYNTLRRLKKKKPRAYSVLMSTLYEAASKGCDRRGEGTDSDADGSSTSSESDGLIDIDAFEKAFGGQ